MSRPTVIAIMTLAGFIGGVAPAGAEPLYTARAGRACDNCHTDPSRWKNPETKWRKCSLSCGACHVSPTGGGLRTVAGRFYGQATLPMLYASHRPFKDWSRHVSRVVDHPKDRKNRVGELAFGKAPGRPARMAFSEDRYAGLRADPLVYGGVDGRFGLWFPLAPGPTALFFPMQLDLHLAVHPFRHVTGLVTGGVLGKSQGVVATYGLGCRPEDPDASCHSRARDTFFMVKDAYLMVHQLPYMAYLRAGRFIPPFGQIFGDHTLATRRLFELDQGLLHSRVTGMEMGLTPNYPYLHVAVFRPNRQDRFVEGPESVSPDELPPFTGVDGWGAAFSAGWRDLGFQLGFSGMVRRRDLEEGGNTESLAVSYGFNLWYYLDWLPLTYLGEVATGMRQRSGSGHSTGRHALLQELNYLPFNGLNVRLRWDYGDLDTELLDDHYNRLSVGWDLFLLPVLGLSGLLRVQLNGAEEASAAVDYFIYIRGWY